jgi:hypothetical protein
MTHGERFTNGSLEENAVADKLPTRAEVECNSSMRMMNAPLWRVACAAALAGIAVVLGSLNLHRAAQPSSDSTWQKDGTGHEPPAFAIPANLPKFRAWGESNGFQYVVHVAYIGTMPVKVSAIVVNGQTGVEGCSIDSRLVRHNQPIQNPRFVQHDQWSKWPLEMRTGDAFTFTLWPNCGQALAQISINTDQGVITFGKRQ